MVKTKIIDMYKRGRGPTLRGPVIQESKSRESVEIESSGLSYEMLSRIYLID
jgi:hypothetical protein